MDFNQFNWISGLDKSGIIALGLFASFFIIAVITIFMVLKINAESKRRHQKSLAEDNQPTTSTPSRRAPPKNKSKISEKKSESSDPIEQAEIYLAYGLNKQAIDLLEEHLKKNPSDKTASEMLARAQQTGS